MRERIKKSLTTRLKIFYHTKPVISWIIFAGIVGFTLVIAGGVGYTVYDYTLHDPTFCLTCHPIMNEAYATWQANEHAEVGNCHDCHHLTPENLVNFAIYTAKGMPTEVPERPEGKVIVPDKHCMACHWSEEKQHGDAAEWMAFVFPLPHPSGEVTKVSGSRFHALHYFLEPTACLKCHGQKRLHVSRTDPQDCLDCHEDQQERQHLAEEVELACLNCHTDRTADLNPDREKCLLCHGEDPSIRMQLLEVGTMDVRYHQPSDDIVVEAVKITQSEGSPMQSLTCHTCHQAHQEEATPPKETCITCHPSIKDVGQHALHLNFVAGDCLKCHASHTWQMTEEEAQQECGKCHQYYEPVKFIQAGGAGSTM